MGKIAFLFSGQGAQYVGMGHDIANKYTSARKVFDEANEYLDFSIRDLCFEGPETELIKTENTQPAILTTSVAILRVIEEFGIRADVTAGLSLGEYTSLVYSGALCFEKAVKIVKKRGKYMQEAVPVGKGTMAAIMGLSREEVDTVIKEVNHVGIVEGANYNCPGQIVISGEVPAIEAACIKAKELGAKRAKVLPVSAPFHSKLLKPAGDMLSKDLEEINIGEMSTNVISNVTANYIREKNEIKDLLVRQVYSSVLWQDSIERMIDDGVDVFIEIGPGKTLTSFTKKISKEKGVAVECHNVEDIESLENLIKAMSLEVA